jgi:spoIIIJ-associated protein
MPMDDLTQAANTVADFLRSVIRAGRFRLRFRVTAGDGARDPDGLEAREIYVELSGPDASLLTGANGELLRALEHLAAKLLRLESAEHDRISFDAENFKALRARELRGQADAAAEQVRRTGQPYAFAPMSSRERRMLHLALKEAEGVETASAGEGAARALVVYPAGFDRAGFAPPVVARGAGRGGRGERERGRGGRR